MAEQGATRYDLLIAHAPADRAWVEGYLADALRQAGLRWTTAPAGGSAARRAETEQAVANSSRVLLILSRAYLADGFTDMVALLARHYGTGGAIWPVSPLLLQAVQLPARLPILPTLDATDPRKWLRVINRVCSELGHPMREPAQQPPCPYPGLLPFTAADVPRFYGRDAEVGMLLGHLRRERFVLVTGASGVGKTSLIEAGLIPQLPNSPHWPPGFWVARTMRPGAHPVQALAEALQATQAHPRDVLTDLLAAHFPAGRVLLVIDHFEDLFTLSDRDEQARFLAALGALRTDARCALVLVMRSDFYPDLMTSPLWPVNASQRLEVEPLSGTALRMAVQQPALLAGVQFEGSLLGRLLADANTEPDALPLLQETLVGLWSGMEWRLLAARTYARLAGQGRGGLAAAFIACTEASFRALPTGQQVTARRVFLRLVQLGEGRSDTARPQLVADLGTADEDQALLTATLQHLAAARLITLDGPTDAAHTVVQMTHEVLIVRWPRLRAWLREERAAEQTRRAGERQAGTWMQRDIAHWLAQPATEPVGVVAVSPLVKRSSNGHANGTGNGHTNGTAPPGEREGTPAGRQDLLPAYPVPERPAAAVALGERARVPDTLAILNLFRDADGSEPHKRGPALTTVLDEPAALAPAPTSAAVAVLEPPTAADDPPFDFDPPLSRAKPAPAVEDDPPFTLPTWAGISTMEHSESDASYLPLPALIHAAPAPVAELAPDAPAPIAAPPAPEQPEPTVRPPEDSRDQAVAAARERLARLAVLRVEEDQRQIDAQARALWLHRLTMVAGLLLVVIVALGVIWLLGNWVW